MNNSAAPTKVLIVLMASSLMWAGVLAAAILGMGVLGFSLPWILFAALASSVLVWFFLIAFGQMKP